MEEIHQTHISNILSFLHRKSTVNGFKTLRNAIQIQIHQNKPTNQADKRKKIASMCSHCFTYWKEGNFSVKFKPKYKSGKNISKRMVLKCLICNHREYQSYEHHTDDCRRKSKPITKKDNIALKAKSKKYTTKFTSSKIAKKTKNNASKQFSKNKSKQKLKRK